MSASGSTARNAMAVFAIAVSAAIGFSLLSSSAASGGGGAPFLTQAEADERYLNGMWVRLSHAGDVVGASHPGITAEAGRSPEGGFTGGYWVRFPGLDGSSWKTCTVTGSVNFSPAFFDTHGRAELGSVTAGITPHDERGLVQVATLNRDGEQEAKWFTLELLC